MSLEAFFDLSEVALHVAICIRRVIPIEPSGSCDCHSSLEQLLSLFNLVMVSPIEETKVVECHLLELRRAPRAGLSDVHCFEVEHLCFIGSAEGEKIVGIVGICDTKLLDLGVIRCETSFPMLDTYFHMSSAQSNLCARNIHSGKVIINKRQSQTHLAGEDSVT